MTNVSPSNKTELINFSKSYSKKSWSALIHSFGWKILKIVSFLPLIRKYGAPSFTNLFLKKRISYFRFKKMKWSAEIYKGTKIYTIKGTSPGVIFYIYGSGNVLNFTRAQWKFVKNLAQATNQTIVIPIYPVGKRSDYSDVMPIIEEVYSKTLESYPSVPVNIIGSSSGGSIAVLLCQKLQSINLKILPANLFLFSPWLDFTLSNPDIKNYMKRDPIINISIARKWGSYFMGGMSWDFSTANPISGININNTKIWIFSGKCDILFPDMKKWSETNAQTNPNLTHIIFENMYHGFGIHSTKEGKLCQQQVYKVINEQKI